MISIEKTLTILKIVFSVFMVFHIAITISIIFLDIIPVDYLWGGQLKTKGELFMFELISILVQTICLLYVLLYKKYFSEKAAGKVIAWILFIIFSFNTVGNILAKTLFEKIIFTPVTLCLSLLMLRIALTKKKTEK